MLSNQELAEKAVKDFQSGFNCTQSILLNLYGNMAPEGRSDLIPKIASGFGGGMGLCGSVCGALTGTIMAIGIKYGSNEKGEEKNMQAYAKANELYRLFEQRYGTVLCRELIKYDLSNPAELDKARQEGVFGRICTNLVRIAMENYLEMENKQL
jgi:C_GCAxxG_C_C family probable redox protein